VRRWGELNAVHKQLVSGTPAPVEMMNICFSKLDWTWPPELNDKSVESLKKRIKPYMLKATGSQASDKLAEPNADYEAATTTFVERVLNKDNQPFCRSLPVPGAQSLSSVD